MFYYYKEQEQSLGIPIPIVVPDRDVLGEEELKAAREEGLLFVEEAIEDINRKISLGREGEDKEEESNRDKIELD